MIKLCYKEYDYKMSLGACKSFFDSTGLDLQTFLMDYISCWVKNSEESLLDRLIALSKLYTRDICCHAFYALIKEKQDGISLSEIQDATYRVSWVQSERDDDMSEPYPIVLLNLALEINDYFYKNSDKKKADTKDK